MSDMTGENANDLNRNLICQGLDVTWEEIDRARFAAEAAMKQLEEAEMAAEKRKEQEAAANNTKPVPTHPRFDPELIERCQEHKQAVDNWIGLCENLGKLTGKEWDELALAPGQVHIYYRLTKSLIEDILQGNYVAVGYVCENYDPFANMLDLALVTMCMQIWAVVLRDVGEMEQAQQCADALVSLLTQHEDVLSNACGGGECRGPYPVFTAFAHSSTEAIDENEVRTRYEELLRYANRVMKGEIPLRFAD